MMSNSYIERKADLEISNTDDKYATWSSDDSEFSFDFASLSSSLSMPDDEAKPSVSFLETACFGTEDRDDSGGLKCFGYESEKAVPVKSTRKAVTKGCRNLLESIFKVKPFPNSKERHIIAEKCGITPTQVRVWFTNKRARTKSEKRQV
nr:putative transcription factor [Ogataea minuta]